MDTERSLKIREDVEGALRRVIFRDDAVSLNGPAGIARIADIDRDPTRRLGERALRIPVAKRPIARHVARKTIVQNRRVGSQREKRIDDAGPNAVLDVD